MAKYQQFAEIRLKDGRIGAITDVFEPDTYFVDVGSSPKDWDNITVTEADIERLATKQELDEKFERSKRELREMGLWGDKP